MGLIKKYYLIITGAVLSLSILAVAVTVLFIAWSPAQFLPLQKTVLIQINHQNIRAEVVSAPQSLYLGLSNRPSLCANCGMLFTFTASGDKEFVMRNMEFPLDIIFINQSKIIKIAANLPPEGNPPNTIYDSDGSSDEVLEVNAGYAAKHEIKVGDTVFVNP
jgi:hypothetical protein